jgi:hypothetical protein
MPEPVVVLYKALNCKYCTALSQIWDSVKKSILTVYPKMRFFTVTAKGLDGKFDENSAPKDLKRWGAWFPMILLIPGGLWDDAMSKLGPRNDVILMEGIQVMNGVWSDAQKKAVQTPGGYSIREAKDFARWVTDAMKNEKFIAAQNGIVPTKKPVEPEASPNPSNPIQPILSSITRPGNTRASHELASKPGNGDVCSMRIISRPRH